MGTLTRREKQIKRKLERRPAALSNRDIDTVIDLLNADDVDIKRDVLERLATDIESFPDRIHEISATVFELFEDDQTSVRLGAIELAGHLSHSYRNGDYELGPGHTYFGKLRSCLDTESSRVRLRAVSVLGRLAATFPEDLAIGGFGENLVELVEGDDPMVAGVAAQALGHVGPETDGNLARDTLVTALYDANLWVRVGALWGLGTLGCRDPSLVADVRDLVGARVLDDKAEVRREATATLIRWAETTDLDLRPATEEIAGQLDETVDSLEPERLQQLTRVQPAAMSPIIEVATQVLTIHERSDARKQSLSVLRQIGEEKPALVESAIGSLTDALSDEDPDVRRSAVRALRPIGVESPDAVESVVGGLTEALSDEDSDVRESAVRALRPIGVESPDAVESVVGGLTEALSDEDSFVRGSAVRALRAIGVESPDAVESVVGGLTEALSNDDSYIRGRAAEELGAIGEESPDAVESVVEGLTEALSNDYSYIRGRAAGALGVIGEESPDTVESAVGRLTEALSDEDSDVRREAAEALGAIGGESPDTVESAVEGLTEALSDERYSVRKEAAKTLRAIGGESPDIVESAVEGLTEALSDERYSVRKEAAGALGAIGGESPDIVESAVEGLTEALSDERYSVRKEAAKTLRAIGGESPDIVESAVEGLTEALSDERYSVRKEAAKTLRAIGGESPDIVESAVEGLTEALSDEGYSVRKEAAEALGAIGGESPDTVESAVGGLTEALSDEKYSVRREAAEALGAIGGESPDTVESAVGGLTEALSDGSLTVRWEAAGALGAIGGKSPDTVESAVGGLTEALSDEKYSVRREAAEALGAIGGESPDTVESAVGGLTEALSDGDSGVRREAAGALGAIGGESPDTVESAVEGLTEALSDEDSDVRESATGALGAIGRESPGAVESAVGGLTEALSDIYSVRREAAEVLGAIVGESPDAAESVVGGLTEALSDEDSYVHKEAANALAGQILLAVDNSPLLLARSVLANPKPEFSSAVVDSIASVAETYPAWVRPLTPALRETLAADTSALRAAACRALGALGDSRSRDRIEELAAEDEDRTVRRTAQQALQRLSSDEETPEEGSDEDGTVNDKSNTTTGGPAEDAGEGERPTIGFGDSRDEYPIPDLESYAPPSEVSIDVEYQTLVADPVESFYGASADVYIKQFENYPAVDTIAVKTIKESETFTRSTGGQFETEAQRWSQLDDHPHIVSMYDWGYDSRPWLALEYMDGGTLARRVGQMDPAESLWTALAISRAVWYAHRHSTHHRDLKPANVLFRETDDDVWDIPKVADWGSAKRYAERTSPTSGYTPEYAAPEQLRPDQFEVLDERTDIFQLGILFYELFTGTHPFEAEGPPGAVVASILRDDPTPPSRVVESLPGDIDSIVSRALAKEPTERYANVHDIVRDLKQLLGVDDPEPYL